MTQRKTSRDVFVRLEAGLEKNAPEVHEALHRGATKAQIGKLEKAVGVELPASFCDFYRWHNGADEEVPWLDGLRWLSVEGVTAMKAMMDGILDDGYYANWEEDEYWSKGWVPFADDGSGYAALVVDTLGSFGGTPGQVMRAAAKDLDRVVIAPSFDVWLEYVAQVFEQKQFDEEDYLFEADGLLDELCPGYPKSFEPTEAAAPLVRSELRAPTRTTAWPDDVDPSAAWLVQPDDKKTKHYFIALREKSVVTWAGSDEQKLKKSVRELSQLDEAKEEHDKLLRGMTKKGFSFIRNWESATRGDCLLVMQTNSYAQTALAGDGRTIVYAKLGKGAKGAELFLADAMTGRRTRIHEVPPGDGQTFVHMVAIDAEDRPVWQLDGVTQRIDSELGAVDLASFRSGAPFNPHASISQMNASGSRLLAFHGRSVRVLEGRSTVFEHPIPEEGARGNCHAALSPSGRRVALIYDDYNHGGISDFQIFEVDAGTHVASVPLPISNGWKLHRFGFSPDETLLIVARHDSGMIHAIDIAHGKEVWKQEGREWAYSPDGELLAINTGRRAPLVLFRARTLEPIATFRPAPWAIASSEIHWTVRLMFSRNGEALLQSTEGGTVYLWKV